MVKSQDKEQKVGKTTVTTACGAKDSRNSGARLPEHLTAWPSRVTCPECLA